jgi:hypothetical protein
VVTDGTVWGSAKDVVWRGCRGCGAAVEEGCYETPRDATLSTIPEHFDVSSASVSKNRRRVERKRSTHAVDALDSME